MTEEEIQDIIQGFAKAAALCKRAGIDGIEIHAVHEGYLLDQFTMPAPTSVRMNMAEAWRTGDALQRKSSGRSRRPAERIIRSLSATASPVK